MDSQSVGLWGGIGGSVIGLLGGLVGTYCSFKRARGPRGRAFVLRTAVVFLLGSGLFLGALVMTPAPDRFLVGVPCLMLLAWGIPRVNRHEVELQREEAGGQV